jgi:hypothetical protein
MSCGCQSTSTPCQSTGCLVQLDFECSLYNKDNSELSQLTNLALTNGSSLKMFAESVDVYIGQIKASNYNLPYLRSSTTINTLKQFAEAVDSLLQSLGSPVSGYLGNVVSDPASPVDGNYWFNVTSGDLKIKANGTIRKITTTV